MRIIAGKYKSRVIERPQGTQTRPVEDKVREAIFNILGSFCIDAKVLDLYSGSGSFGIEAFSRGAKEVIFVDNNRKCIETIKKNLKRLDIREDIKVIKLDVLSLLRKGKLGGDYFDIIFVDPPYYTDMVEKTLMEIDKYDIISTSGVIATRSFKKDKIPHVIGSLKLIRQNAYGGTIVSFYKSFKNKELGE